MVSDGTSPLFLLGYLKYTFTYTVSSSFPEAVVSSLPGVNILHLCCWPPALPSQPRRALSLCPDLLSLLAAASQMRDLLNAFHSEKFLLQPFIPTSCFSLSFSRPSSSEGSLALAVFASSLVTIQSYTLVRILLICWLALPLAKSLLTTLLINAMHRLLLSWTQSVSKSSRLHVLVISPLCLSLPPFLSKKTKSTLSPAHLFKPSYAEPSQSHC